MEYVSKESQNKPEKEPTSFPSTSQCQESYQSLPSDTLASHPHNQEKQSFLKDERCEQESEQANISLYLEYQAVQQSILKQHGVDTVTGIQDYRHLHQPAFERKQSGEFQQESTQVRLGDIQGRRKEENMQHEGLNHQNLHHNHDQVQQHLQLSRTDQEKTWLAPVENVDSETSRDSNITHLQSKLEQLKQMDADEHAKHAFDSYLKSTAHTDYISKKHSAQYASTPESQSLLLSYHNSPGKKNMPSSYPFLVNLPVPVSTGSAPKQANRSSSLTWTDTLQSFKGRNDHSDEPLSLKISKGTVSQQFENFQKETEMVEDALALAKISNSSEIKSVMDNVPVIKYSEVERHVGKQSTTDTPALDELHTTGTHGNVKVVDAYTRKQSQNTDTYTCLCNNDFLDNIRYKTKKYMCGCCSCRFISICELHIHLETHGSGGSYHYDHISRIAYPKYDTFCSFTQTDNDLTGRMDEFNITEEPVPGDTLCEVPEQVDSNNEIQVLDLKIQKTRKCRKRKQDNPKPTKPKFVSAKRSEKGRVNKRKSDSKQKNVDFVVSLKKSEGYEIENECIDQMKNNDDKTPEYTVIKQEVIDDENESCLMSRPLRKRGRPRKSYYTPEPNVEKKRKVKKDSKATMTTEPKEKQDNSSDQMEPMTDSDLEHDELSDDVGNSRKVNTKKTGKQKRKKYATKYQMCDICGIPVPKYEYVYHMRKHTGEKPYICDQCGKPFAHRRFLVKHLLTHAEDKPWKCNLCPAQFCQKNEYSMHMNGHEGKRPYDCKVCEMKFFSRSMLNTHQANVHMGITRFECEVCSRRFFKRSSLTVHQATHYEATLKCNFCERMFKDKTGLKRHERIHTGEKRFRCHVCAHEFIQSTPYWVHMERKHQMKRETVKNMLKDIRDSNKKVGKRTEINELPKSPSHLPEPETPNVYPLVYTEGSDTGIFTSHGSAVVQQHHRHGFTKDDLTHGDNSNSNTGSPSAQETLTSGSQSIVAPSSMHGPVGLGSMGLSLNSLQHGFIGLNPLQQPQEYSSSLPSTGTYTDISRDGVYPSHANAEK